VDGHIENVTFMASLMSWNRTRFAPLVFGALRNSAVRRKIMPKQSLCVAAVALLVTASVAAQNEPSQDPMNAPTGLQSKTADKPPVATVPEAATDVGAVPRKEEPTTGQAPNVSKKMGAEMDSAGDQRAAPDQE
jgi:hypothetical protein